MKNISIALLLATALITSKIANAALPDNMPQSVYDEIVQEIFDDVGYYDSIAVEEAISQWLLDQPLGNTDGLLLDSGSCDPCEADTQGIDNQFKKPRQVEIKAKIRPDGKYPTILKIKWKRPRGLDPSLNYEVSHYLINISKDDAAYEVLKVPPKYKRNGKLKKKQSIKFKDRDTGDYDVQVQAIYIPIVETEDGTPQPFQNNATSGTNEQKSKWTSKNEFSTEKFVGKVGSLTGQIKVCVNDNGYPNTQLLSEIKKGFDCPGYNLLDSDIVQIEEMSNIRVLDISNNTAITDISGLRNLNYLEYFNISNNINITTLNFE